MRSGFEMTGYFSFRSADSAGGMTLMVQDDVGQKLVDSSAFLHLVAGIVFWDNKRSTKF